MGASIYGDPGDPSGAPGMPGICGYWNWSLKQASSNHHPGDSSGIHWFRVIDLAIGSPELLTRFLFGILPPDSIHRRHPLYDAPDGSHTEFLAEDGAIRAAYFYQPSVDTANCRCACEKQASRLETAPVSAGA